MYTSLLAAALAAPGAPLTVETGAFTLAGRDATRQLVVTATGLDGKTRDATREAKYDAAPAGVVAVDPSGFVTPLKEGTATITARFGGATATAAVTVTGLVTDAAVSFENQVVPVFTKFGCNAGGCHGKADGQNGFRLSLLGFEPREDYEYLVKEGRGRRLFAAAPEYSLLLRKAAGTSPHGGGKKLDPGSPFYRVLSRWVEQGAPFGSAAGLAVTGIRVVPENRVLSRGASQQIAVLAVHADGSVSDVTRMTQFESNAPDLATADGNGLVTAKQIPGAAAVMARYQSHVGVFQATVPLGAKVDAVPASDHPVDKLVFARLKELGLPPSPVCDDATFLRRATIDIAGRLPTKEEVEAFARDAAADKRDKLIDRLLADPGYADYFANKWGAVLRNRRKSDKDDPKPTAAFHEWIRDSLKENKPFDRFVREVLTATGAEVETPPVVWYRELRDPTAAAEDAAQLFLGQRVACAKCHHHPLEKWAQQDYWGFAAFFTGVKVTDAKAAKKNKNETVPAEPARVAAKVGPASATNPRTGKPVPATGLAGAPAAIGKEDDPRAKLADWMTDPKNPFFARTLANRYWKHFLGRGLVDPEDDLRLTNPPTNPALLDFLAKSFADGGHDLKKLVRLICTSKTYQLSGTPNADNADDRQNYSRFVPKRLTAEVLLDAIDDVTLSRTKFKTAPAGTRAVQLPDNLAESYFLGVFGRPDASSACECERGGGSNLAQALHMLNSAEVLAKAAGPRAQALAKDSRPPADRVADLYAVALGRKPTADESAALVGYAAKRNNAQAAWEDVVWAVINTREFLFNH
jgi:hypothetical protein